MPKYVCDFDALNSTSRALRNKASDLRTALSSCQGTEEAELANWTGDASNIIKENNQKSFEVLKEDIDTIEAMADYLDEASKVIQAAEDSLSSLKI